MHYSGSKATSAKAILYYMLKNRHSRPFVEPFLGGANVMCNVPPDQGIRIGSDYNHYIIALWKALQDGWQPPLFVTREEYNKVKDNMANTPHYLVGYVGTACSYNGYWFGGYVGIVRNIRDSIKVEMQQRQKSARLNIMSQVPAMFRVQLHAISYERLTIPNNSLIYCDPPYLNVSYKYMPSSFNHDVFWQWCREKVAIGHTLFISEYVAPEDFISIWNAPTTIERGQVHGGKDTDKLFVHKSQLTSLDVAPPIPPKARIPHA